MRVSICNVIAAPANTNTLQASANTNALQASTYTTWYQQTNTNVRNVCDTVMPFVFERWCNVCARYDARCERTVRMRATRAMFVQSMCVQTRRVQERRVWATCTNNGKCASSANIYNADTINVQHKPLQYNYEHLHYKYHKYKHLQIQCKHSKIQSPVRPPQCKHLHCKHKHRNANAIHKHLQCKYKQCTFGIQKKKHVQFKYK